MKTLLVIVLAFASQLVSSQNDDSFTIVYNNVPSGNHLKTDWGYAAWIEIGHEVILFDSGTKANLLQENFKKLNLDPTKITAIAISHEHYDHTGGLESILEPVKKGTPVFLPNDYNPSLKEKFSKIKFTVNDKYRKIAQGVWLTEIFIDYNRGIREQALVLEKDDKVIMITGCAHPGIVKMCEAVKEQFPNKSLELVTGGFHLMRTEDKDVAQISNKIKELGFEQVAPSHCTGDNSIAIFEEAWGDKFVHLNLGDSYRF